MSRVILAALVAVCLQGCRGDVRRCAGDADCLDGATCREGLCVRSGGAGGGATGGGSGGGGGGGPIDAGPCAGACSAATECVSDLCVARYQSLALAAPMRTSQPAQLGATLTLASGRAAADPSSLPFTSLDAAGDAGVAGVLLRTDAGVFIGVFDPTWPGVWHVRVEYPDAGLSASQSITFDRAAPSFTVSASSPPARRDNGPLISEVDPADVLESVQSFRRNERARLIVRSDDSDLQAGTVVVSVNGLTIAQDGGCAGSPFCGVYDVDLAAPPMPAFRMPMGITVTGRDDLMNSRTTDGGALSVTRFRWSAAADGTASRMSNPAVDSSGNVVVTRQNGISLSIDPSGNQRWTSVGALLTAPIAGAQIYVQRTRFVVPNTLLDTVSLDPGTGAITSTGCSYIPATPIAVGQPALGQTDQIGDGTQRDTVVFSGQSSSGQQIDALTRFRTPPDCAASDLDAGVATTPMIVWGSTFFNARQNRAWAYTWNGFWDPTPGWPSAALAVAPVAITYTPNTSQLNLAGNVGADGGVTTVLSFDRSIAWTLGAQPRFTHLTVGRTNVVFFSTLDGRVCRVPHGGTSLTCSGAVGAASAPVLGEGGLVYVSRSTGGLVALDATSLAVQWSHPLPVRSELNLDCARADAGGPTVPGRPGSLYGVDQNGTAFSVIVDSRGLDPMAPWPKWQHDPGNTANAVNAIAACP